MVAHELAHGYQHASGSRAELEDPEKDVDRLLETWGSGSVGAGTPRVNTGERRRRPGPTLNGAGGRGEPSGDGR